VISVPKTPRELFKLFMLFNEEQALDGMLKDVDFSDADPRQIFYTVLRRLPDSKEIARNPNYSGKRHTQQLLHSTEFQQACVKLVLKALPELKRIIFIHVPKCAGTDLIANLAKRFLSVNHSITAPAWTPKQRLFSMLRDIVVQSNFRSEIFLQGHFHLQYFINNQLLRYGDRVFTVVRDPASIIISQVNYILTRFIDDREQKLPDTREWLKMMNMESIPADASADYFRNLASAVLQNQAALRRNYMCTYLGRGDYESAIANVRLSDIEITDTKAYNTWLKTEWGIDSKSRSNVSKKIMSETDVTTKERDYIRSITSEDQVLYDLITSKLSASSAASIHGGDL
jgi:hypothetical protein